VLLLCFALVSLSLLSLFIPLLSLALRVCRRIDNVAFQRAHEAAAGAWRAR
jgi:hypothetical protein